MDESTKFCQNTPQNNIALFKKKKNEFTCMCIVMIIHDDTGKTCFNKIQF